MQLQRFKSINDYKPADLAKDDSRTVEDFKRPDGTYDLVGVCLELGRNRNTKLEGDDRIPEPVFAVVEKLGAAIAEHYPQVRGTITADAAACKLVEIAGGLWGLYVIMSHTDEQNFEDYFHERPFDPEEFLRMLGLGDSQAVA